MFEVILTYRPDFQEKSVGRFATYDEAQAVATQVSREHAERIIRAWVRQIRAAKTNT